MGKVQWGWAPTFPVTLAIGNGGDKHARHIVVQSAGQSEASPFFVSLHSTECASSSLEVSAVLPDGTYVPLAGSPVAIERFSPTAVGSRPTRSFPKQPEDRSKAIVDIVIPVYAGREETLTCLNSVLATTTRIESGLVVVNDASPDPELCEALAGLAAQGRITLLTNRSNLGFPGAANRGMSLHPDRDVILLNADAEPFGDWLERLRFAAYSEDDIGTVTPLGEAASIASYPASGRTHTRAEAEEIDGIARTVNARNVVELPVGVGFCLYIKRACIAEVGGLDESRFCKGYGEENDFCLRARGMGWRHVAATDLFVRHRGARSYGRTKQMLIERNDRVLNALHPGYGAMVAAFVAADPLLVARRSIDIERLLKDATDPVLLVTFDLPGGVKRHVDARQRELREDGHTVLVLQPSGTKGRENQVVLNARDQGLDNLAFHVPEELSVLRDLLLKLRLSSVELHHFVGLPPATLELVISLGVPYDVYIHDYSWVCPRMTLVGGNGIYCGEPPIEDCETCIQMHGTALNESLTVEGLRLRTSRVLRGAQAVIVPAEDVRTRLARYFPGLPVKVAAWECPLDPVFRPPAAISGRVRVAVVGAISLSKGHQVLLDCARDAVERDLDLEFVVIGFTSNDESLLATGRVFITGPYAEDEVGVLLEREQCHVAMFPSVVPETWCYALSHALARGLPIVAFDLGAIAERLRSYLGANLLPLSVSAAITNDTLLQSARRVTNSKSQKESAMDPTPAKSNPSDEISASVQILTLPTGIYTFTVKETGVTEIPAEALTLPALQVGLAPKQPAADVTFLARDGTSDRWLASNKDMIIAKIFGESASLLLTSLRLPNSSALAIDVRRLGDEPFPEDARSAAGEMSQDQSTQIVAHIQYLGDIPFTDSLVGCIGERLWIEALSIRSLGPLSGEVIEYCAVTADGFQTPWLGNQMLCGSRGRGIPMVAYAIRLKPEVADQYDCSYTGKFVSGSVIGPVKNGELCCSDVPRDPLWGIELRVTPRSVPEAKKPGSEFEHSNVA